MGKYGDAPEGHNALNLEINLKPVMMQVGDAPRCRGEYLDALE
jgi:hypothetical protein